MASFALLVGVPLAAQKLDPIKWTLVSEPAKAQPGATVYLKLTAKLDEGWHLYSVTTPPGGPNPTTIKLGENPVAAQTDLLQAKPDRKLDPNFGVETETFEHETVYWIVASLSKDAKPGDATVVAELRYQACTDKLCLPPRKKTVEAVVTIDSAASPTAFTIPTGFTKVVRKAAASTGVATGPSGATPKPQDDLAGFLLVAFGLGLTAIFTPCVFPMIPITVSFFVQQKGGFLQAIVFCLGIILFFCAIGLGVTAILGPFGVVQIGSNPWVNGFIATIFFIFGLSLLGAFEITLPSSLLTKLDSASRQGGLIGTLLMGLTFTLTSFACVGPFMGTLLASSVQGSKLTPVLGMGAFATGLSLPFFFLALFPSYLKKLPRSGGWMSRIKVVLGFIVMALIVNYLAKVDQALQLNYVTREIFLAAWFVFFALPGLYLLGFLRLEGIKKDEELGVGRLLAASVFLIFSFSLLPGMFGAKLGELDAYVPPPTFGFGGAGGSAAAETAWIKNDMKSALEKAKAENKLVLVSFTGYACTNCHWMKANMFPRPEIQAAMKDVVLLELYTDGTDDASKLNQDVEEKKFGTVAIPFYALIDADEKTVASFPGLTKKAEEFLAFLKTRS
ncbi:MAG: cytochrome c biogenesis protein CcdA [Bryobacteraceae bacterium]